MVSEDTGNTMDAIGCTEKQAEDILEEIERQKSIARFEQTIKILRILQIKCNCRIRGLSIDIENQREKEFYQGAKVEYEELLRHLSELKYIKADIRCAWKYLNDEERREYYELTGDKGEQDD